MCKERFESITAADGAAESVAAADLQVKNIQGSPPPPRPRVSGFIKSSPLSIPK